MAGIIKNTQVTSQVPFLQVAAQADYFIATVKNVLSLPSMRYKRESQLEQFYV